MAATVSPATGRHCGVARVCQAWDVPRSSFYAARQAAAAAGPAKPPARRGPKPAISDDALLAAIKDDLARSPWTGEGHRKAWARLSAGAARGVALRHDHGSDFMADDFQRQARFWGLAPSYAFVGEPETNGVIERLFRTLKEQAVHGRVFQTIDEVRDAIRTFVTRYNAEWLIEKNGHRSPDAMRAAWQEQTFRRAA